MKLGICAVLETPVAEMLGQPSRGGQDEADLRARISSAIDLLEGLSLATAAVVIEGLVARQNAAMARS